MVALAEERLTLELRGGNLEVFRARAPEILVEGMAGTGKTRTILELINALCHRYAGIRVLIVRKYQTTLATTCLVTLNNKVLTPHDGVVFFGGSPKEPASYRYPNGSRIVVGGMDNANKILSSEYDLIYCNEATELTLDDHETLTTRLRNGVLPHQRIICDCNPSARAHWLNQRCESGAMHRIVTRLEDNPAYYTADGELTGAGAAYLSTLDRLTGSRYERLRLGLWTGVENAIYDHFDRDIHIGDIPGWVRFVDGVIGVDYGRRHMSAAVAISIDQYGGQWVREAWQEPSEDHGKELRRVVARMRATYKIKRGRVDPNQDVLAGQLGFALADGSAGSRNRRTKITGRLFSIFPGGRVPSMRDELREIEGERSAYPLGPYAEPDKPGLMLVRGAPGINELADQIEAYHEVFRQAETREDYVVARINDDMVAAMEYGNEEAEEGQRSVDYFAALKPQAMQIGQSYTTRAAV